MEKHDILTLQDVQLLVNTFYGKVRDDDMLASIFNERIQDRWPQHLEKMYRFWQTVLLEEHTYYGAPFPPHANLPVSQAHFERWLTLFNETVNELFAGEKAAEAQWRGQKMAQMFQIKIAHFKAMGANNLL